MKNKNRGMFLEKIINKTIDFYQKQDIAIFHKKNIDIVFRTVDKTNNALKLENAYLSKKSTVDYYGIFKGKFVAFEAKSFEGTSLPFKNIATHQMEYLAKIQKHNGIAFFIIFYKDREKFYFVDYQLLATYYHKQSSINYQTLQEIGVELELNFPGILEFINILETLI